ncbi:hypothetical protein GCM10010365_58650 [Streptomyces poonensis]|uniref:Insertion element IS402-like domain-containing protein n=1 Tax=Streptomyces poonensis TaxID=68255 RepID=A0A918US50_9ACTN|nr:hypothetical protein GCM10010365_58650 [Streptomyces poonensis]
MINGMVCKVRTGIFWRDLPECYGPWQTVHTLPHTRLRSRGGAPIAATRSTGSSPGPC